MNNKHEEIKVKQAERKMAFEWKCRYCREKFLNPMIPENWTQAIKAYNDHLKTGENNETS